MTNEERTNEERAKEWLNKWYTWDEIDENQYSDLAAEFEQVRAEALDVAINAVKAKLYFDGRIPDGRTHDEIWRDQGIEEAVEAIEAAKSPVAQGGDSEDG